MVFLDNASTTKIDEDIINLVSEINNTYYYNPSSLYIKGVESKNLIESSRSEILNVLGAKSSDKFIFTSGATESNNLAIRGVLKKGGKLLTTVGEHSSIYDLSKQLILEGYDVEYISLKSNGQVDINDLKSKLKDVSLVSIMHVSNETGAINNIKEIVKVVKNYNKDIIVHSDGVQAVGKIFVNILSLGVDMYTISSHKIHGVRGVGGLYVSHGINLKPLIIGGGHEYGLRSGTENTSGIVAFKEAIKKSIENQKINEKHVIEIKNHLIKELAEKFDGKVLLHNYTENAPYILNFSFIGIKSETLLHMLEKENIFIGNGSACHSKNTDNRVLSAMGMSKEIIDSSVRISFSKYNTIDDINEFILALEKVSKSYTSKIIK